MIRETFKEYKKGIIISCLLSLAPMLIGVILWNKLPDNMIFHWGADGTPDGGGSKATAVFLLPFILMLGNLFTVVGVLHDPKNRAQSSKVTSLIFWIVPVISNVVFTAVYSAALGRAGNIKMIVGALLALTFIGFGNYLPKIRRNSTLGIKIPWTLNNEENWNKTHRWASKLWVAGGFLILGSLFLPDMAFVGSLLAGTVLMAIAPMIYSYILSRKQIAAGTYREDTDLYDKNSKGQKAGLLIGAGILIIVAIMMVSGKVEVVFEDEAFQIKPSFLSDIRVEYADIDSIEFREQDDRGMRTSGFGSARLSMGTYQNSEFGIYTRYTYSRNEAIIVMRDGEHVLVVNDEDYDSTKALYEKLESKISN